jgi:uncharacterized membrane protein YccC
MLALYGLYLIYPRGMKMIVQIISIVSRPIVPTFIHDDLTRIFISLVGLLVLSAILYRFVRYYNDGK